MIVIAFNQINKTHVLDNPETLVQGSKDTIAFKAYFGTFINDDFVVDTTIKDNADLQVGVIFTRPDGKKSWLLPLSPQLDGGFAGLITEWVLRLNGALKMNVQIHNLATDTVEAYTKVLLPIQEGTALGNEQWEFTQADYDNIILLLNDYGHRIVNNEAALENHEGRIADIETTEIPRIDSDIEDLQNEKVDRAGDKMSGDLDMDNNNLENVAILKLKNGLTLASIKFDSTDLIVNIGGTDFKVPFKNRDNVFANNNVFAGNVVIGGNLTAQKDAYFSNKNIKSLAAGIYPTDAVNKGQLETKVDKSQLDYTNTPDTVLVRNASGRVKVSTAQYADEATNKGQMDGAISTHNTSGAAHADLRALIAALAGAFVYRGHINNSVVEIRNDLTLLDARILVLMQRTAVLGDVLVDNDNVEWYYNGSSWFEYGQGLVALASAVNDGLMSKEDFGKLAAYPLWSALNDLLLDRYTKMEVNTLLEQLNAEDISYDNETSELNAENLQEAVDEVAAMLDKIPSYYVMATDEDFTLHSGDWRYTGTDEYVIIPNKINGETVTTVANMFNYNNVVKGVATANNKIKNLYRMFSEARITELELDYFFVGEIGKADHMFALSKIKKISGFNKIKFTGINNVSPALATFYHMFLHSDLEEIDMSSFSSRYSVDVENMFFGMTKLKTVYFANQADLEYFTTGTNFPETAVAKIKSNIIDLQDIKADKTSVYTKEEVDNKLLGLESQLPTIILGVLGEPSTTGPLTRYTGYGSYDITIIEDDNEDGNVYYYWDETKWPFNMVKTVIDDAGNHFKVFPSMWVKLVLDSNDNNKVIERYISNRQVDDGFVFVPEQEIGVYQGALEDGKMVSKANKNVLVSTTLEDFRDYAMANGEGYHVFDWYKKAVLETLYLIVFANIAGNTMFPQGTEGTIQKTGILDGFKHHTGYTKNLANYLMKFMGIENYFSNTYTQVDGIKIKDREVFLCDDYTKYNSRTTDTNDYESVGFTPTTDGYIAKLSAGKGLFTFPTATGSVGQNYRNYLYQSTDYRTLYFGRYWVADSGYGLFFWGGSLALGYTHLYRGSRLVKTTT